MLKKSFVVTGIFVLSTLVQLISQIVITRLFGASFDLDVFLAAVALPTTLVTVIYGTLNDTFLPFLGEKKIRDSKNVDSFFATSVLIVTIISMIVSAAFAILSYPLVYLLYQSRGEAFVRQAAIQMSFMSLSFPISVIATMFGSYFYSQKHFFRFPIAQLVGSVTNILLIIILFPYIGVWSLVLAFVLNIVSQIIFTVPSVNFLKLIRLNLIGNWRLDIRNLLIVWFPLMMGYFALRNDTILVRSFGSYLPTGNLVYLNLISKIFSLATSVMTIGIQIVLLPQLIEDFAKKNYVKAAIDITKTKVGAVILSIVVTLITMATAPILINLLFVGGKFAADDASQTISFLPIFIIPAIGWGINNVFFQPLIALKKQKQLGMLNIISFILAWITASMTKSFFGPQYAIAAGLITLLFTGIIGSEILWQRYKLRLLTIKP